MVRLILSIIFVLFCKIHSGEYEDHLKQCENYDNYLLTWEDKKRLGHFAALHDLAAKRKNPSGQIPKTLHFIWLGPQPFPEDSKKNVKEWIDRHSGWKVQFWTDLGNEAPDDRMQLNVLNAFPLQDLEEIYFSSDNLGERSQILRYAILLNEGGIYIDHDVRCLQPFDKLQETYDFFCGLESLGPTVLSSSVNPSPHLLASAAQHPILSSTKKWLTEQWTRLEHQYPGNDPESIHNRVQHRTFTALGVGFKEGHCKAGRKDVIFPPDYFSIKDANKAVYATHQHTGTWYKKTSEAESKIQAVIGELAKEIENTFRLALSLTLTNMVLGIYLLGKISKLQKKENV